MKFFLQFFGLFLCGSIFLFEAREVHASDSVQMIFGCDRTGMRLAQIIQGTTFFEIILREEPQQKEAYQAFIQAVTQIKSCDDVETVFQQLLQLWSGIGVDFQKEYIDSEDGVYQLERLARQLREQMLKKNQLDGSGD